MNSPKLAAVLDGTKNGEPTFSRSLCTRGNCRCLEEPAQFQSNTYSPHLNENIDNMREISEPANGTRQVVNNGIRYKNEPTGN